MCGISGIVNYDRQRVVRADVLKRMCDTLAHRGPDDEGFFIDRYVGLGMRRLSVIDLDSGRQPIANEDGRVWIVFNGEIYNYPELRKTLEHKGHVFSTYSDTETIVHAYEEYGDDCLQHLNGMFALAIWDGRQDKLLLARDRLGIKPLYYFLHDRGLVFASELKAVLEHPDVPRQIDLEALDSFLTFEYIPAPLSIFQGIRKLPPGHVLVLQDGKATVRQYWVLHGAPVTGTEDDLAHELYDLLQDAVRIRLISDVPLGAFLSGGIDSSILVCMMSEIMERPVQTFSIGFDDPSYNESSYARLVASHCGANHHERTVCPEAVHLVENLMRFVDEPLADVSIFPTYLVSQLAREHVTVVLSGDGGDELFAGYDWYVASRLGQFYDRLPGVLRTRWLPGVFEAIPPTARKKGLVNKLKRFVEGAALPADLQQFRWNMFLTDGKRQRLYSPDLQDELQHVDSTARFAGYLQTADGAEPLWRQQFADIKTFLVDDILVKVDRMSMANSLEARTPYLDHRVVAFAAGLPAHMKLRGLQTKYLLKKSVATKLPRAILARRKEGFSIPMKNWLRRELSPMMQDVLSAARLKREGFFNPLYVEALKAEHLAGEANHAHQLWSLMVFELWRDRYLKG